MSFPRIRKPTLIVLSLLLSLTVVTLVGCDGSKSNIIGTWERTGDSGGLACAYWPTVEFLKGNTVVLENNGSWSYSFPQDGFLTIGGNMGETFQYEIAADTLKLSQSGGYCDYRRLK